MVVAAIYSNAAVIATTLHGLPFLLSVAVPAALIVPLVHRILVHRQPLVLGGALPLIVVFGALQAASTLVGVAPNVSLAVFLEFLTEGLLLFLLITNTIVEPAHLRRAVWVLLGVGAFLGALSLLQSVTGTFNNDYLGFAQISNATVSAEGAPEGSAKPRLAGPIGEINRYAQVLLVLVPLGLVQVIAGRSTRVRLLSAVATGFIAIGVVLTYSRGAAVALALVLVVATAMKVIQLRWFLVVAVLCAGTLALAPVYAQRLATVGNVTNAGDPLAASSADGAIQGRLTENIAALLAMGDHPLLGVGPGAFPTVYQDYVASFGIRPHEGEREAHNLLAGLGAEVGVLGLLCFLALVGIVLRDLNRVRRLTADGDRERAVVASGFFLALVAYLTSGLFLHLAFQRYFWILLALAACASALPDRGDHRAHGAEPVDSAWSSPRP
jgi:O-antigen ligase